MFLANLSHTMILTLVKPYYGQKMKEIDSAKFRQKIQILLDFSWPPLLTITLRVDIS